MSNGRIRRRDVRDLKYTPVTAPKMMVGVKGKVREVYPDPRRTRHGQPPTKPERAERWQ